MSQRHALRRLAAALVGFLAVVGLRPAAQGVRLPTRPDSVKFAVIGDNGNGSRAQYDVGQQMAAMRARFPFELVIMLGDNMYGRQEAQDFVNKFERPYAALLQGGVRFYASLGNHDSPNNRFYKGFNMEGQRYYTFARKNVRFFVLDSNQIDPGQRAWLEQALGQSRDEWKICYFHHPLYSNAARHGSDVALRTTLEPVFTKHGVNVVLSGHDHTYERLTPQKGITYFVEGASGELRRGDIRRSETTAAYFDQDQSFMLIEVANDELFFEAITRTGATVDSGIIRRQPRT